MWLKWNYILIMLVISMRHIGRGHFGLLSKVVYEITKLNLDEYSCFHTVTPQDYIAWDICAPLTVLEERERERVRVRPPLVKYTIPRIEYS